MKKITLLFIVILCSFVGYSQFPENFESPNVTVPGGFPAGWLISDNGVGSTSWEITDNTAVVFSGEKAAYINRQEIGMGNTSEDWLISPMVTIPTNGQLRFNVKQTLAGDNGTLFQIRISTSATQSNLSSYTVVQQFTESQLNQVFNEVELKTVDFPLSSFGTNLYIAFVRVYTQPTAVIGGDRLLIDDINVLQKCLLPLGLSANAITSTSATFTWSAALGNPIGYEIGILPMSMPFDGAVAATSVTNNFIATGLVPDTCYKYYLRSNCNNGNFSEWVGPFNFCTPPLGFNCAAPIVVPTLPYQTTNNTANFGNSLAGPQNASCVSGGVNYLAGNDVFYSYTATEDCNVNFTLNSNQPGSSIFMYPSCNNLAGPCLAAAANATSATRTFNYAVTTGTTYIIVVSSSAQSPAVNYNLLIQCESCPEKPTNLTASNLGLTSADLSWTAPNGTVLSYEVAVQPEGASVPSGSGVNTGSTSSGYTLTDLIEETGYQYWVRSECAPGIFSAWAGPMLFLQQTCTKPINLVVSNISSNAPTLSWTEISLATQWEVLLLAAPNGVVPAVPSVNPVITPSDYYFQNLTNTSLVTPMLATATIYYYYVRSVCAADDKSAWSGPFIFNTDTCNGADQCAYKFYLSNPVSNSWSSGTMQVRQNGIVIATLGESGVNSTNGIEVEICNNIPFDLYWSNAGPQSEQLGIMIEDPFETTVFNKLPGEGIPGTVLFTDTSLGNCLPPSCPKPILGTGTVSATTANLSWTEVGTATAWEVFVTADNTVPDNNAPINPIAPGYYQASTNTNFIAAGLIPMTQYSIYVRAICSPTDLSAWTKIYTEPGDKIVLNAFVDANNNGIKEETEIDFPYGNYTFVKNNDGLTYYISSQFGTYTLLDQNPSNTYNFNFEINPEFASYYAVSPTNYTNLSITEASGTQNLYFPITITQVYNDVQIYVTPLSSPRPGFPFSHRITYKNVGHNTLSGTITYTKDNANVAVTSVSPAATATLSNGFTYNYSNLLPGQTRYINVNMLVATIPTVNLGDVLTHTVSITPSATDINLTNNSNTVIQTVVGSYDPNDKNEARGSNVQIGQFNASDYLFYTIRFQNSGTASAETVRIEDTLESEFNLSSIQMVSASHSYVMQRIDNNIIWTFNNINLPSENQDEPGSHGYVTFKIKLNPGFAVGDVIENTAEIYFDFNPAIITNTFQTTFVPNLSTSTFDENRILIYPNPTNLLLHVNLQDTNEQLAKIVIYDIVGKTIKTISDSNSQKVTIPVSDLSTGVYMIEITTASDLKLIRKFIVN